MAAVALVGTLDTRGPDFAFLASQLRAAGAEVARGGTPGVSTSTPTS